MIDRSKPNLGGHPLAPWRVRPAFAPRGGAPPQVSLLTPAGRGSLALLDVLQALRGQSFQDWEWLVLADPPADREALRLLSARAEGDPRVRLLVGEGSRSLGAALREGCRAAQAEWAFLLAPDELLEPTALEKLLLAATVRRLEWAAGWAATHGERFIVLDDQPGECPYEPVPGRLLVRRERLAALLDALADPDRPDLLEALAQARAPGEQLPEVLHWIPWRGPALSRAPAGAGSALEAGATLEPAPPDRAILDAAPRRRLKRAVLLLSRLSVAERGTLVADVAALLARQGWQLTIAALHAGDGDDEAFLARLTADIHGLDRLLPPAHWPRALRGLLESRRPEIVLFDGARLPSALTRYLRARCPESRFVALHHEDPDAPAEAGPSRALGADDGACVVLSSEPPPPREPAAAGPLRLWLPCAVDTTTWQPRPAPRGWLRPQWGAGDDDAVILIAAPLHDRARLAVVADSLAALLRARPDGWIAVLAGEGPERAWLESQLVRNGVANSVRWIGALSVDTLLRTLAAVDVVFAPAHGGFASLLPRAMAMELPVVAADVGGQRSLVTLSCGRLVDPGPGAEARYAEALSTLVADPGLRRALGREARRQVLLRFGPDRLAQALEDALTTPLDARVSAADPALAYAEAIEQSLRCADAERARRRARALEAETTVRAAHAQQLEAALVRTGDELRALRAELEQREQDLLAAATRTASLEDLRAALAAETAREAERADAASAALADAERRIAGVEEALRALQRERLTIARQLGELGRWRPIELTRRAQALAAALARVDRDASP